MSAHTHIENRVRRWAKENLFCSWISTLLTLAGAGLLTLLAVPTITFIFKEANWKVIVDNLHLFAVGSYPTDQLWRVLLSLVLVMGLVGVTVATQTTMGGKSWVLFTIVVASAVWIVFNNSDYRRGGLNAANHTFLIAGLGFYLLGYFTSKRKHCPSRLLIVGWFCYFLLALTLLSGFRGSDILPKVENNLWGGLLLTFLVTVVGIVASFPFGIALALGRRSDLPIIKFFCIGLIEVVRGVPLITLLFLGQVLIPLFLPPALVISNLVRVMIAVTFFAAAYMAEYIRGGLQALSSGQMEAARALGMNAFQTNMLIVLPQAIRAVIPALVGECIALFKDTSLVAIVGLLDLMGAAKAAIGQPDFIGLEAEVFMAIAIVYWVFSFLMSKYSRNLEQRLEVGVR